MPNSWRNCPRSFERALRSQIVNWYKKRWTIEQFFRILKTQGLRIEDSRIETADRLLKLTAIAAKAAVITLQLVQARDGQGDEPASLAWAAWIIARLGGWDGYPRTRPGSITIHRGLAYFLGVAKAARYLEDV